MMNRDNLHLVYLVLSMRTMSTKVESKINTRKLRVCLEGQKKHDATEIEVAGDSVSGKIK